MQKIVAIGTKSKLATDLLNYLYGQPIILPKNIAKDFNTTPPTANAVIRRFVEIEILKEITGYSRNRQFAYTQYLNLF